ncbi:MULTISPECIES: glycosyltransferase family 4 protein [unclassified Streptomyces]|uniref:glycosyltransferase family 4 protein n=1 Tax=unclassified Streptomyces TaxID=2593676 RepID=UPI000996A878|nr:MULTISPECIES: glycosyltransferase family 4 protein [unclassified Streptomyces]
MTLVSSQLPPGQPPRGQAPLHAVQVLGGGSAGSSAHVRSLAAGLVARGVRVTVCAPTEAERTYDFTGTGAAHVAVDRSTDPSSVAALRAVCADADLVHAHGLHAGLRASLALGRRVPFVVTWHTRAHAEGPRAHLLRLLERRVAKAASILLGTSSDLVDRARQRGARDARLAAVALPAPGGCGGTGDDECDGSGGSDGSEGSDGSGDADGSAASKARAELGAVGRPLLLAAGALERHRGHEVLLDAVRVWRHHEPEPLLVIAGEGPLRPELQRRIEEERLPVLLLGSREDVAELLAAADLALLPSSWESRSVLAQEALRAGVPLVATAVGGTPELVGDAAELVPYGDAEALGAAVVRLLGDAGRRAWLVERGVWQAGTWPTEDATVAQVLSVYDELTSPVRFV